MSAFEVTPSQLKSTADQLEQLNSNFSSTVTNLESTEQSLSAMWEGESKQAFQQAFQRDKGNMDAFSANITKFVETLRAIAERYEGVEIANTQTATTRSY
jgi:WXG100 family type VII secretion target